MDRRMVALLDVLERTGRLVPVDARAGLLVLGGPRLDNGGAEGAAGAGVVDGSTGAGLGLGHGSGVGVDIDPAIPTAPTVVTHATPTGGRGLAACASAASSTSNSPPSGSARGQPHAPRGGGGTAAAPASPPPPIESYRHLLLDRLLPPVGDTAAPGTAGAEMTDRFDSNADCFEAAQDVIGSGVHGATTKKRVRGGRGRRTKTAASSRKERPGRGTSDDGRPPSLGTYLAGLSEARLRRANIQRRALEREEGYGLASALASSTATATANGVHAGEDGTLRPNDTETGNENIVGFDARGAAPKGRGTGGHPQTLATDRDGDNLAPKHCFGRKWLYELVCEPTGTCTATGGSSTAALAEASSKGNVGPAKKKRRRVRVLGAAPPPKTGGSVLGGGTARTATSTTTTVGKDVVDHRICIRCRHCKDGRDCLRPSSLSDTHFYNLLVFWANNHYERCEAVPAALRARYDEAKASKARGRKSYWTSEAHAIGLRNVVDQHGRIGSGVAFAPAVRDSEYW